MHEVETPDGIIEFPDEMQPDEITAALNKQYAPTPQQLAAFSLQQGISLPSKVASMYGAGAAAQRKMLEEENRPRPRLYGGEPALPEATPEVLGTAATFGAQKAGELWESLSDITSETLRRFNIDPSAMPGRNILDITPRGLVPGGQPGVSPEVPIGVSPLELLPGGGELKTGIQKGLGKFASGFTEPGMATTVPFAAAKPVQALFGLQAAAAVPESIRQLYQARTPEQIGEAGTEAIANIAMGGLIGRHLLTGKGMPYARSVEEAAKVYGDLRAQPIEGEGQVPAEIGGEGVRAQAQAVAEAAQVPLKVLDADELLHPVEAQMLQSVGAANGLRGEVQVVENHGALDPENKMPFRAKLAQTNPDGSFKAPGEITISRDAFRKWIEGRTPETLPAQVGSALAEEIIHSFTTKKEAVDYLNSLTDFERETRLKFYLGEHAPEDLPGGFPDWQRGSEVLRQHIQELMRLRPNEIIERAKSRTGQWTKDGLYLLTKLVRRIREFFGTQAAEAGGKISYEILDRMERNVNAAAEGIGEEAPFMLRREEGESEALKTFRAQMQDPTVPVRNTQTAKAGMGLETIGDLDAMLQMLRQERALSAASLEQARATGDFSKMRIGRDQYPREVIETATKTGSWEGDMPEVGVTGERPLQWDKNPEVADWLRQHSKEIFSERSYANLPDELKAEPAAAMLRRGDAREQLYKEAEEAKKTAQKEYPPLYEVLKKETGLSESDLDTLGILRPALVDHPGEYRGKSIVERVTRNAPGGYLNKLYDKLAGPDQSGRFIWGGTFERPQIGFEADVPGAQPNPAAAQKALSAVNAIRRHFGYDPLPDFFRAKTTVEQKMVGDQMAMLRRKEGREESTLPGMAATKGKGVLTKPETAPAAARPEFVKEPATPLAVDKASYEHFYTMAEQALTPKGKAISFPDYAAAMRVKFGPISTPALVEAFDRNMWPALMGLSGDKIAALRDKMNLRKDVGAREVSDPPQREGLLKGEVAPARAREERKARAARQNYRNTVISAIGRKLTEDTLAHVEKQGSLTRTEVSPFDLWKPRDRRTGKMKQKAPVQPIYNELTTEERNSPALLEKVLTDDAREMKAGTVSATKRLTVLQHRDTGKVEMVSTFRDPRRGAVLLDPQSPSGTHSPLRSIFERYRPIASVLLDDPVKSFRKSFNSLADYEAEFGKDARSAAQPTFGERPMGEEEVPGVPIYRPDEPITRNEAMAIVDHVESEVGGLNSAEAVKASLESLPERLAQGERRLKESYYRGKRNVPTPEDVNTRSAASAYLKQMTVLAEKFPDASVDELVTRLADQIYENHKAAANIDEFVTRTMAQGAPEAGEVLPTGVPTPIPGRVESVVPKLTVEPRVIPGGRGGAFIPKEEPSRMLTPEEQAYVKSQATPEYPASLRHILYRQLAQAKVPEKPYTVGKDYTPVEREKGEDVDGPEEGAAMLTRRDIRDKAEAKFWTSLGQIRSMFTRHGAKQDIASVAARASTLPINLSQEAKREIELWSASKKNKDGDPKVLAAARAINAAYVGGMPDQAQLGALHTMTTDAQAKAAALLRVPTDLTLQVLGLGDIKGLNRYEIMNMARQWLHAAEDLQKEVEYAQAHFGEQNLMRTTRALRRELNAQLQWERNHGRNTKEAENYLPGLYKGEIYGDNSVTFESQILGKQFGKPKSFANTYEAIQAGPFIPKLNNVAEIAAHRIRSGLNAVLTDEAFHAPLHMTDPATGTPIAVPMDFDPKTGYTVPKGLEQYRPVYPLNGGPPMAVRRSYAGLMEDLFSNKGLTERNPFLRGLVQFGAIEKHSTLAGDAYHFFKMMDFGLSVMRTRFGWKSGYSALEYRPGNMAEAVRRGLLRQKDMDWALTPEQVNVGGTIQTMTRQEISKFLQDQGLNVGRVQDAMYKHFVDELDVTLGGKRLGLGRYTRFLFDKFTRGIMNQAAVESFLRHNKDLAQGGPPVPAERIAKRIIGDINTMFGSAGKQALIKNPTLRDISQLLLLAPQWTGTRISMEARFLSRLATTPYVAARYGLPEARLHAGPIGRGVGTGLVMMFGITQVINLLTRHHLTFQNPEEGHKLDAYIPDPGGGPGFFVSPLSIFMEMTHDVARFMAAGHKNFMETLTQIASNKMHPVARGVLSGITGFTPTGQKITTMGGRAKAVAAGLVPVPISGSALGRYVGHTLTDRIAPNAPGAGGRQLASTFGIKAEVAERATSQLDKLAKDYMERNKIKPPTGWEQVQTDEPNYTKLRSAIRAGDNREAIRLIQILRDEHPPKATKSGKQIDPVVRAMEQNAKRNFTTKEEENAFYNSLTPGQKRIYEKSIDDREAELDKFYRLYDKVP